MTPSKRFTIPRYLGLNGVARKGDRSELEFGFTPRLQTRVQVDQPGLNVLKTFLSPKTPKAAARKLGMTESAVQLACDSLVKAKLLKRDQAVPSPMKRYDRHLLFYQLAGEDPVQVQRRISQSTVALIGMGGIGNWVSLGLIGAGLKRLKLIDFDKIELSNLTRQVLFDETDLGRSKVEVAAKRLSEKNRQTEVMPLSSKIDGVKTLRKLLKGVDFVVLSADRPAEIHDWVDQVCIENGIPYLNIGYRDGEGVVGPLTVPGLTSCYQCFKPRPKRTHARKNGSTESLLETFEARYQAPSFGPLNGLVSSIGVVEILKYLGGFGAQDSLGTELRADPLKLSIAKTPYKRDKRCWQCRKWKGD